MGDPPLQLLAAPGAGPSLRSARLLIALSEGLAKQKRSNNYSLPPLLCWMDRLMTYPGVSPAFCFFHDGLDAFVARFGPFGTLQPVQVLLFL